MNTNNSEVDFIAFEPESGNEKEEDEDNEEGDEDRKRHKRRDTRRRDRLENDDASPQRQKEHQDRNSPRRGRLRLPRKRRHSDVDTSTDEDEYESTRGSVARQKKNDNSAPWFSGKDYSPAPHLALNREIHDFLRYISPTPVEHKMRAFAVARISRAIKRIYQDAFVSVFGSYNTKLYLPTSDLDIVVLTPLPGSVQTALRKTGDTLQRLGVATNVSVVAHARVPIIKFTDRLTGFRVDVSFNADGGINGAKIVKHFMERYPAARPLILIVKHHLMQQQMNEVYTGGLSSYSIMCMVVSFLQMHPMIRSRRIDAMDNLGVLLLEFFELYGANFNYERVGLRINCDGSYIDKFRERIGDRPVMARDMKDPFRLSIEDPNDSTNDISRGSFGLRRVMRVFRMAFTEMTNEIYRRIPKYLEFAESSSSGRGRRRSRSEWRPESYLSVIITIDEEMVAHRARVQRVYETGILQEELGIGLEGELDPNDAAPVYDPDKYRTPYGPLEPPPTHSRARAAMQKAGVPRGQYVEHVSSEEDESGGFFAAAAARRRQSGGRPRQQERGGYPQMQFLGAAAAAAAAVAATGRRGQLPPPPPPWQKPQPFHRPPPTVFHQPPPTAYHQQAQYVRHARGPPQAGPPPGMLPHQMAGIHQRQLQLQLPPRELHPHGVQDVREGFWRERPSARGPIGERGWWGGKA